MTKTFLLIGMVVVIWVMVIKDREDLKAYRTFRDLYAGRRASWT